MEAALEKRKIAEEQRINHEDAWHDVNVTLGRYRTNPSEKSAQHVDLAWRRVRRMDCLSLWRQVEPLGQRRQILGHLYSLDRGRHIVERRLAAVLAADVVGYSRLMGEDEAGTLERLKSLHKELMQPKITEGHGRIVKLMGDGLLAEFASVVEAVQCAVDIQQSMIAGEADLPDEQRIKLRIGVNLGDIIVEGADIYGDGVNIASRLESLAEPGGICLSGDAYRQAKGKIEAEFEDMGEQGLKNIAEPVRVYRIASTDRSWLR